MSITSTPTKTRLGHRQKDGDGPILVRPLTPVIGAEVSGAQLSQAGPDTVAAVRRALLAHKVVFLRGQQLDADGQVAFASQLGRLTGAHPTLPSVSGRDYILELDSLAGGRADHWHTDVTFTLEPPAISVLRVVKVPEVGGDTQWASTEAAYDRLPRPLQELARQLHAVHTNAYDYGAPALAAGENEAARRHRELFTQNVFETEHPVAPRPSRNRPALLALGRLCPSPRRVY